MKTRLALSRPLLLGIGGSGCNAIEHLLHTSKYEHLLSVVDVVCVNTDAQSLYRSTAPMCIQIGSTGLGAGSRPDVARNAAESSKSQLLKCLADRSVVVLVAGLGGGTGSGASPYIASLAKSLDITTLFVGTLPFEWESGRRVSVAKDAVSPLSSTCDATFVLPNDMLLDIMGNEVTQDEAFFGVNEVIAFALGRAITPQYGHDLLKDALGTWNHRANWSNLLPVLADWERQTADVFGRPDTPTASSIITLRTQRQLVEIARDPCQIYKVSPRKFEELMFALYRAAGLRTELTKQARDDGVDLLVWTPGSLFGSEFLTIVQLKRYTGKQRVGSPAIRELKGTQALFDAHRAECISTTSFTKSARSTANLLAIDLAEFSQLCEKVKEIVGR